MRIFSIFLVCMIFGGVLYGVTHIPEQVNVVLLVDTTSIGIPEPTIHDIQPWMPSKDVRTWKGIHMYASFIRTIPTGEYFERSLDAVPLYKRNVLTRTQAINEFTNEMHALLAHIHNEPRDHPESAILSRIIEAVELVPDHEASVVIVYTDMMENSTLFNAYTTLPSHSEITERIRSLMDMSRDHAKHRVIIIPRITSRAHYETMIKITTSLSEVLTEVGASLTISPRDVSSPL